VYQIKKQTLESIIMAARNVYPNEFFSMLGGKNRTIEELVVVPATYGEDFSSYRPRTPRFTTPPLTLTSSHSPKKARCTS